MSENQLIFLKLGGSLITDKTTPMTPRLEVIDRLANEIAQAFEVKPNLKLIIGHGSGSFGHAVANLYQTQAGGDSAAYWQGFSKVWAAARSLNQIVLTALSKSGLPVIAFPPSSGVIAQNKQVQSWDISPIQSALSRGLIPVVYGDVVFDTHLGGTILSTEDLFLYLTGIFNPIKILLAGIDHGVYEKVDNPTAIIPLITPTNFEDVLPAITSSQAVDVTGGMRSKVQAMVRLVKQNPVLRVQIFSGDKPGNLSTVFTEHKSTLGTIIAQDA